MLKHLQSSEDWDQKSIGAKGFTLIELLVVIVILGILAAVVVFAVSGISDKGQKSACETEARTVRTAQEAFNAKTGAYAPAGAGLVPGYLSKAPTLVNDTSSAGTLTLSYVAKCNTAGATGP